MVKGDAGNISRWIREIASARERAAIILRERSLHRHMYTQRDLPLTDSLVTSQRCSKMVEPCENADLLRTPTIIVNEQGAITQFNESASRMLGYTQVGCQRYWTEDSL